MATGPKASTSWTAVVPCGSSQRRQDGGEEGAVLGVGAERPRTRSGEPATIAAASAQLADAGADLLALGEAGERAHADALVGGIAERGAWRGGRASASATASSWARGTMARRMAVHFCPALTVISRATSLTKRSNSGRAGGGVGAEDASS